MDDTCNAKWLGYSSTVSTSFYENNAFHSYVMPLSSDASLCIMENPSRSQHSQDSSPKLENLLGNATMGSYYENYESEAMGLSLDSIYYQQNVDDQETQRQQEEEAHMQYFSGMSCYEMYQTSPIRENVDYQTDDLFSGNFKLGQEVGNSTIIHDHGSIAPVSASVESMGYGDLQCLSLSMSPGSQSSSITPSRQISPTETHCLAIETKKRWSAKNGTKHRKSIDTFGQRTSQYRGVTRHRWTGRYEAHLWDNSSTKEGQTRKGRQVYLGGYGVEEKAAIAYDCAALKYWGSGTHINFPLENYQQQLEDMKSMNRQEYVAHLRRRSSGFSRGASIYRGVTKHHQQGKWQARIGRVSGNKDLYLGTFRTQEDAAEAYDIAAIKFRGANSVTNFEMTKYDVEKIMASDTLLAGEQARRINDTQPRLTNAIVEYVIPSSVAPSHDNRSSSDWKLMLNQFPDQQQQNVEPVAEKAIFMGHEQAQKYYKNLSLSVALQDIIGDETSTSTQLMLDDSSSTKIDNGHHFSDPSSLVTSLSSSREASPDKPDVAASMLLLRQLM